MNLPLYAYVLWKHRRLLAAGLFVAVLLALASVLKVGPDGVSYRQQEQWISHETVLVTQSSFPVGRTVLDPQAAVPARPAGGAAGTQFADPGRFTELAALYSRLVTSDPVRELMLAQGRIKGALEVRAQPVTDADAGPLPLIDIAGVATSPSASAQLAGRVTQALRAFIVREQKANDVRPKDRVVLTVIRSAGEKGQLGVASTEPTLLKGRSVVRPVMVFVVITLLFAGLALILENARWRKAGRSPDAPIVEAQVTGDGLGGDAARTLWVPERSSSSAPLRSGGKSRLT